MTTEIAQLASDIRAFKIYYTATWTLLAYDYCLTFLDEIEFAWNSEQTLASILFLLNRYLSLIFSTVVLISYYLPSWTYAVCAFLCNRFAVTEFVYTVLIFTIAEIFLALRVHVLTRRNRYISAFLALHILVQLGLAFYNLSLGGGAAQFPPFPNLLDPNAFQVCILFPEDRALTLSVTYLSLGLSFDAFVLAATLITTISAARGHQAKRWIWVVQRDGVLYFLAIFSSTLIWLLFNQYGRSVLKLINAVPNLIFISVMINRLYLSLKKAGREDTRHTLVFFGRPERLHNTEVELQVMVSQQITSTMLWYPR
ncbi:hypothetical protein Hypma_000338 [Hypsizygus marmoreus]|uniref:DUF6533 domain-containing protein n=1 Tax=Hypsizygus marmoreus TaxID=39966 RepID=A0A369JHS9_HYPMA|nr:hypothetical protein Hypma_000338 [Hypsizygus marmoreus]